MPTALITGVAGQDGTILSAMLARDGVDVVGLIKPGSNVTLLRRYVPDVRLVEQDLADLHGLTALVSEVKPDELYNLGGFTAPAESWEHQEEVQRINVDAVEAILNALRAHSPRTRMFQASSASVFEGVDRIPQDERTEFTPKTPYGESKLAAMQLVDEARERDGLFTTAGILYNHESPIRGDNFVTRRVTKAVARISRGLQDSLELGDIEVARDWGWAPDYVRGMRLMLAAEVPRDYVLASGISHRLSFFIRRAFESVGILNWADYVTSASDRKRSVDTNRLVGDTSAIKRDLGWRPTMDFDDMVRAMVAYDLALLDDPEALWTTF